jgi:hypothetical protein
MVVLVELVETPKAVLRCELLEDPMAVLVEK